MSSPGGWSQCGYYSVRAGILDEIIDEELRSRDFPDGLVIKILPSNAGGAGSIPDRGAKIPHALWPKKPKYKTEAIL